MAAIGNMEIVSLKTPLSPRRFDGSFIQKLGYTGKVLWSILQYG